MKLSNKYIKTIQKYFQNKPVLKAYLFGSYVRDEASKNSDIDILVELDYDKRIGLQFVQMKIDLENLLNKSVDFVSSEGISKYIRPLIDKEKLLIYEK